MRWRGFFSSKTELQSESKAGLESVSKAELASESKAELPSESKAELAGDSKEEIASESKAELNESKAELVNKSKPEKKEPIRRRHLNWFSKVYFCWIWGILRKGRKEGLGQCEIPPVPEANSCRRVGEKFISAWNVEVQKKRPSLRRLLIHVYWKEIAAQGIMFLFSQGLQIWRSLLLGFFLDAYALSPKWILTRILAGGLIVTSAINVLTVNPWNFLSSELGMNMCTGLTALLYDKSLRLSASGLCLTGQGEFVNLLSNDVKRLETRIGILHALWIGPLVTVATFCILWFYVGEASAAGLLALTVVVTLSSIVSVKSSRILEKIGALRDSRLKLLDEIATNIRQIKIYCWENVFQDKVDELRSEEVSGLTTRWNYWALYRNLFITSPRFIVFVALFAMLAKTGVLNPGKAFVVMTLYNTVTSVMSQGFPSAFFLVKELNVSLKRCQAFLSLDECAPIQNRNPPLRKRIGKVVFKNYSGKRPQNKKVVVRNINLKVQPGKPMLLIGGVGCGKSTIFAAILGDIETVVGSLTVRGGGVAMVSQSPWTFPATLRENIILGNAFIPHWYSRVLDACALTQDISTFLLGDLEVLGDKGITLSGGQKARVSLARALYADTDVYLIDNVLGSVDAAVGAHILTNVVFGLLKSKCVLMTSNSDAGLEEQSCLLMEKGEIVRFGKYKELQSAIPDLFQSSWTRGIVIEKTEKSLDPPKTDESLNKSATETGKTEEEFPSKEDNKKIEEDIDSISVLTNCVMAAKQGKRAALSVLILILFQLLQSVTDIMLTKWTNESYKLGFRKMENSTILYICLLALDIAVGLAGLRLFYNVCTRSGAELHKKAIGALIRTKLRFFSKTTTGSIMNRFSMDMSSIEEYLPKVIDAALFSMLQVTGMLGVVVGLNEVLAVPAIIAALLFYRLRAYYLRPASYLRREEAIGRGPVYTLVNSTLEGLSTIRSLGQENHFKRKLYALKDEHTAASFVFLSAFNWFIFWTDLIILLFTALAIVASLEFTKDTAVAGLTLSLIFTADNMFSYGLQQTAELGNEIVSVVRMMEYGELDAETTSDTTLETEHRASDKGGAAIEFKNVDAEYVPGVPVLSGLNCTIYEGEKVGIVGRTGSGKTSFLGCILRLLDISNGEVFVDGMNVKNLQLHDLRSHISVISQTPALVEGTLRYNLDMGSQFSDEELWDVLTAVQLKKRVESKGLNTHVEIGGSNFSHGERQILSLARAMLEKNSILLIDELTANIDKETENVIQEVIAKMFGHCTIVAVAHNLNAVINSDTICVLDRGKIMEWESPQMLLKDKESMLSQLVQQWLGNPKL